MTELIKAMLVRTSNNFWEDCIPPEDVLENYPRVRTRYFRPFFNCDMKVLQRILEKMSACGLNAVLFDVGDSVRYQSRPDVGLPDALTPKQYKEILSRCRDLGLEPFPKLNFSSCHDAWLGKYSRMLWRGDTAAAFMALSQFISAPPSILSGFPFDQPASVSAVPVPLPCPIQAPVTFSNRFFLLLSGRLY